MPHSDDIIIELQELSPFLARMEKVNVFEVPKEYFVQFPAVVVNELIPEYEIKSLPKLETQKIPEGYFDSLSNQILDKIKQEEAAFHEENSMFLLLNNLKNKKVFTVPSNYFDTFSQSVFEKIKNAAPVVSILRGRRIWKIAAAAVITGLIAITSLQILNKPSASLSETNIAQTTSLDYSKIASLYNSKEQVNNGIASLKDDDIVNYLEKYVNMIDVDTLSSDINTSQLPETIDYLIDDNTLQEYLESMNSSNSVETIY